MTNDLAGAWRLVSWSGGHVSATLMGGQPPGSLAYAGRYEVRDDAVCHSIEVATDAGLVGMTTTRHMKREDDVLTLSGPDFRAGTGRSQKIVWRRVP